ncbi:MULTISPECIES: hypothetical protein [unclassified Phenylobacterium]|uniref:hypothetical protein n=1 Tax=unclassified Phenylobacterium TaxID=2640670 RepID=UPI00083A1039|nr:MULTISPECIES: hypothetical protein [unclassified Phenylobacterium]
MGADKAANNDKIQSEGRKDNAAQPLNAAEPNAGAERYPPTSRDDGVEAPAGERRGFDTGANPQPRQGAGDGGPPPSVNEGRFGPGGDPAEGKR